MSASEKLRALEGRWWKDADEAHPMFYALPQIIAQVEAAEAEALWKDGLYDLCERTGGDLGRRLAALDEALP